MNAFQRDKIVNSLRVLRVLLGHAKEIREYARRKHGNVTLMTQELLDFLSDETIMCVLRGQHINGSKRGYEARRFTYVLESIISDLEEELRVLDDKDVA